VPVAISGLNNIVSSRSRRTNACATNIIKGVYATTTRVNKMPVYVGSGAVPGVSRVANNLALRVASVPDKTVEVQELIVETVSVMKANVVSLSVSIVGVVLQVAVYWSKNRCVHPNGVINSAAGAAREVTSPVVTHAILGKCVNVCTHISILPRPKK
jgi:hypothetical protein